jgi:hypothetical protein
MPLTHPGRYLIFFPIKIGKIATVKDGSSLASAALLEHF